MISVLKLIPHNNATTGEDEYINVIQSQPDIMGTISEIDLDAYIHTSTGHGGVGFTKSWV